MDQCFLDLGPLYVVPCSKAHSGEVFDVETRPEPLAAPWPGTRALVAPTSDSRGAFEAYVGVDVRHSELKVYVYTPSETHWSEGRRRVVRFLRTPDLADHKGSLRDSHR